MALVNQSSFPSFTLRKHSVPITSLGIIRVPTLLQSKALTNGDNSINNFILKPFLASSDENGRLLVWDMVTHRPIIDIKAHSSQIMTVKQLGLNDNDEITDPKFFGIVLTHGRDHIIKFWSVFDQSGQFHKEMKLIYELPVNALNFSNIDVIDNYLVSPNTLNSNFFDIYDIEFLSNEYQDKDDGRLKRLFNSVNVFQRIQDNGIELKEFTLKRNSDTDDVNREEKFGIIMRLLWISKTLLFIGYESGHVIGLNINFRETTFTIHSISSHHFPNPVLSLSYDSTNNVVVSSSIKSEVIIHDVDTEKKTPVSLGQKFGKISSIASMNDLYVFSSWNGYIKFFQLDKNSLNLTYVSSFKKPKGSIAGDLNTIGNLNDDGNNNLKNDRITKPNTLIFMKKESVPDEMKKFIHRRDLKVLTTNFLAIGYDDGTIMVYSDL